MADNLRTRIATTMLRIFDEDRTLTVDVGAWIVADAVIRELDDMGIIHLSRVVGCKTGPVGHERECR